MALPDPHRVTAEHIRALAVADQMRGGRTCLVDTDEGIKFVTPAAVLAPGSGVRRLLMSLTDLAEDAASAGLTCAAFVKATAAEVADALNAVLAEK